MCMMDNGKKEKNMAKEPCFFKMETIIPANGNMEKSLVKEHIILMVSYCAKGSGTMANSLKAICIQNLMMDNGRIIHAMGRGCIGMMMEAYITGIGFMAKKTGSAGTNMRTGMCTKDNFKVE